MTDDEQMTSRSRPPSRATSTLLPQADPPVVQYKLPTLKYIPSKFVLAKRSAVDFAIYDNILLYNTKIFASPPTSWSVLFDPKYAGKVALPPMEWGNGIMLLQTIARLEGTS